VQSLWKAKEIHITENGCASDDVLVDDGKVYDTGQLIGLHAQRRSISHPNIV
jgi:beta-glucosidase